MRQISHGNTNGNADVLQNQRQHIYATWERQTGTSESMRRKETMKQLKTVDLISNMILDELKRKLKPIEESHLHEIDPADVDCEEASELDSDDYEGAYNLINDWEFGTQENLIWSAGAVYGIRRAISEILEIQEQIKNKTFKITE
jgi:hypothetical protein